MSYGSEIQTRLNDKRELRDSLIGGIYLFEDSGRKGINRVTLVNSFKRDTGQLKAMCIVYEGAEKPTLEVIDMPTGLMSTETPIFIWLYDGGNNGYDVIDAASRIIKPLLHGYRIPGGLQVLWNNTLKNKRERLLEDACYYELQYTVHGWSSNS